MEDKVHELMNLTYTKKTKVSNLIGKELLDLPGFRIKTCSHGTLEHDFEKNIVLVNEQQKIVNLLHDLKVCVTRTRKESLSKIVPMVTYISGHLLLH